MKRLLFLFLILLSQSIFGQKVIKIIPGYVLIDTDSGIGNVNDIIIIYRLINGMNVKIGYIKIVQIGDGKTAAKIIKEIDGYKIQKLDFVNTIFSREIDKSRWEKPNSAFTDNKIVFGIGGGFVIPTGEKGNNFNTGYTFNLHLLQAFSSNLTIGFRVASINNITLNKEKIIDEISSMDLPDVNWDIPGVCSGDLIEELKNMLGSAILWDISGKYSGFELSAFLRANPTSISNSFINPFLQGGFGLYIIKYNATLSGNMQGDVASKTIDDSENKFGFSFGGGLHLGKAINKSIEIVALYHKIFTTDISTEMISINCYYLF